MHYEQFRNEITAELISAIPAETLHTVLSALDRIAVKYDIKHACTDLSIPDDDIPQLVKMYLAASAVQNLSQQTLDHRLIILRTFFGTVRKPCEQVTTNDIRAYFYTYKQQRGVSDSTIDQIRCVLHGFYSWTVNEEYLLRNPVAKIGPIKHQPAERKPLTPIQLETIRAACVTLREKALIDVLYSTACRVAELCALERSDVDLDAQTVVIRHGKGDKRRVTYLNAEAVISLRAYLDSRTDDSPFIFVSDRKPAHQLTSSGVQKIIRDISARTALKIKIHPHLFRHTAATVALRAGMPVEQVQRFLGHAKIDTTLIYAKTDDSSVQENHRKYIA